MDLFTTAVRSNNRGSKMIVDEQISFPTVPLRACCYEVNQRRGEIVRGYWPQRAAGHVGTVGGDIAG